MWSIIWMNFIVPAASWKPGMSNSARNCRASATLALSFWAVMETFIMYWWKTTWCRPSLSVNLRPSSSCTSWSHCMWSHLMNCPSLSTMIFMWVNAFLENFRRWHACRTRCISWPPVYVLLSVLSKSSALLPNLHHHHHYPAIGSLQGSSSWGLHLCSHKWWCALWGHVHVQDLEQSAQPCSGLQHQFCQPDSSPSEISTCPWDQEAWTQVLK